VRATGSTLEPSPLTRIEPHLLQKRETNEIVRKLIDFDEDTFDKLKQLGRDRMATIQELADEAFADVLRKHNIPVDLKDALRKSAALAKASDKASDKASGKAPQKKTPRKKKARSDTPRKTKS